MKLLRGEIDDIKMFKEVIKGELTVVISELNKKKSINKEKLSTKQKNI